MMQQSLLRVAFGAPHKALVCRRLERVRLGEHPALRTSRRACAVPFIAPEPVFDVVTVAVMPVYAAMMFAPRSRAAKVLTHDLVFLAGGALYAALWLQYGGMAWVAELFKASSTSAALESLVNLMQNGRACSIAWLHLLFIDMLQARHVFVDSVNGRLPDVLRVVSLGLCFMAAPVGLLSHVLFSIVATKKS